MTANTKKQVNLLIDIKYFTNNKKNICRVYGLIGDNVRVTPQGTYLSVKCRKRNCNLLIFLSTVCGRRRIFLKLCGNQKKDKANPVKAKIQL